MAVSMLTVALAGLVSETYVLRPWQLCGKVAVTLEERRKFRGDERDREQPLRICLAVEGAIFDIVLRCARMEWEGTCLVKKFKAEIPNFAKSIT
jgi:hypothetical protein